MLEEDALARSRELRAIEGHGLAGLQRRLCVRKRQRGERRIGRIEARLAEYAAVVLAASQHVQGRLGRRVAIDEDDAHLVGGGKAVRRLEDGP